MGKQGIDVNHMMDKISKFITARIQDHVAAGTLADAHHDICSRVCDEFECWQLEERPADPEVGMEPLDEVLPDWVMYLVQGMMREDEWADHMPHDE